jgi:2-polyprenyl-3-methyl-5-hydroxy-6-metoxy-1,4-benzoquinol methylase
MKATDHHAGAMACSTLEPEVPGAAGYAQEAKLLLKRYEGVSFVDKHRCVLHLIPREPCDALDIGAGSGVDAAWLADKGHRVLAIEPTLEFRVAGMAMHPSPLIEWIDDSLPALSVTTGLLRKFDLVMITAVWMHLDEEERGRAMRNVASMLKPDGVLLMSLRHGPAPMHRPMFEVTAEETTQLGRLNSLHPILSLRTESAHPANRRAGVQWSHLAFDRSDRRR